MSNEGGLEVFRSQIQFGKEALRAAMLINGGAAVALLAFVGGIWPKEPKAEIVNCLAWALILFSAGLLLGAAACSTAYITQYNHNERIANSEKPELVRKHQSNLTCFLWITISLVFLSLAAFFAGIITSFLAIRG